jgi:ATPase subunit of ABC transporter with duplicated ATPase domains
MKVVLLGQNGAGKTTLFKLIEEKLTPEDGDINKHHKMKISHAKQIFKQSQLPLTVTEYFQSFFEKKDYALEPKILKVLKDVNLSIPNQNILEKKISEFSGGQQGRLLLAGALIQNGDLLLLDEPTNNLDKEGIDHLVDFLKKTKSTCIVISHDSEFLEKFSDGLLYLNADTQKVEQYSGTYQDVLKMVANSVAASKRKNSLLQKNIDQKKKMESKFAN